jgi:succinoglycan biosynthesis protein ExoO
MIQSQIDDAIARTVLDRPSRSKISADVSVVVAAYNVEKYIGRAIDSALDQEGVSVEVIVVDDNSTDGTPAVVTRIDDPRVKFISLSANRGPSVARNVGIAAATAPWIAVLDSDDMFLKGRLARCLLRAKLLDADIVVDNLVAHRESDQAEYPMFRPRSFSRIGILTLEKFTSVKRFFPGRQTPLGYLKPVFRAEFLRQHRLCYDPSLRNSEDYLLMCEALASGARCAVEPTAGYLYAVRRNDSLTSQLTLADLDRMAEGDKRLLARYRLSSAAMRMQRRQECDLKDYYAYVRLADALKRHNFKGALKAAAARPVTVRHLWLPAGRRLNRFFQKFEGGVQNVFDLIKRVRIGRS